MATYTAVDASAVSAVGIYSDAAATVLVEDITANVQDIGTGLYEASTPLTYSLYTLGVVYYLKITYTPTGDTARSQVIPIMVVPQGQAAGSAAVTVTDCDGAYVQAPPLVVRVGRGDSREAGFESWEGQMTLDRFVQELRLPDSRAHEELHLEVSCARAGAPFSPLFLALECETRDEFNRQKKQRDLPPVIEAPSGAGRDGGFRSSGRSPEYFLRRSLNLSLSGDAPVTRPGYRIQRQIDQATATFLQRVPVDQLDGTMRAALMLGNTIYEDGAPPTSRGTVTTNPYGAAANKIPRWVFFRDRTVLVDGTDFRVLIWSGGQLKVKSPLIQPSDPTLSAIAGTDALADATYFLRLEERDADTETLSGPNRRTSTAQSQAIAAGEVLRVQPAAFQSRTTHFRVQMATADAPESYQIAGTVHDAAVGGAVVSDANGWIPVAEIDVYVRTTPASGIRMAYRKVSGISIYRHATPPAGAAHVAQFQGRLHFASDEDTWLVFTEPLDPEGFYTDPTDPNTGFNTFEGEGLVDTIASPCKALVATESQLFFCTETSVHAFSGSFILEIDANNEAVAAGREIFHDHITQGTEGALCGATAVVDHDVYLVQPSGPGVLVGGAVLPLDVFAVREVWDCRDPVYDHRICVGYLPKMKLVLFAFVSKDALVAGVPDTVLAWSAEKKQWCPPWKLSATSFTRHRITDVSSGNDLGVQLVFGGPYGSQCQLGYGYGDGEDGSDADAADLLSTADTATTATVAGKTWTTDEWRGKSLVLTDRTTGRRYTVLVKSNTATVLTWEGTVNDSGGGWILNLGGIHAAWHTLYRVAGVYLILKKGRIVLNDWLSKVA